MLNNPSKKVYAIYFCENHSEESQVLVFKADEGTEIEDIKKKLTQNKDIGLEITEVKELSNDEAKKFDGAMIDISSRNKKKGGVVFEK